VHDEKVQNKEKQEKDSLGKEWATIEIFGVSPAKKKEGTTVGRVEKECCSEECVRNS